MTEQRSEIIRALKSVPGHVVRVSIIVAFFICAIVVDFLKNVFDRIAEAPAMLGFIVVLAFGLVALWQYSPNLWRACCRPSYHLDKKLNREKAEREAKRRAKRQKDVEDEEEAQQQRLAEADRKARLRALIGYDNEEQKQNGGQQ